MAYKCPRCGGPVRRGSSSGAAIAAGLVGALFYAAFGAFQCKTCGKIAQSEFPAQDRTKMVTGTAVMVICAVALVALLVLCAWFMLPKGSAASQQNAVAQHDATVQYDMGNAVMARGQYEEAIADYANALRLNPDYAEAHNNLGAALAHVGRVMQAMHHFMEAVRLKPGYAEAHNNLGACLFSVGRVEEAIAHTQMALDLARSAGQTQLAQKYEACLARYRVSKP